MDKHQIRVEVHIKDKLYTINCAEGEQKVRWLGDVAVLRYQNFNSSLDNFAKAIKLENDEKLDMGKRIRDVIANGQHVWVVLDEDLESGCKRSNSFV